MGAICNAMLSTRYAKAFQDSTHRGTPYIERDVGG
jgi:hypothetical protein